MTLRSVGLLYMVESLYRGILVAGLSAVCDIKLQLTVYTSKWEQGQWYVPRSLYLELIRTLSIR